MVVVTDISGSLGVLRLRFQFRRIRNVGLVDNPDPGMDWGWTCDGLSLAYPLEGLQGVDLCAFQDGRKVLFL